MDPVSEVRPIVFRNGRFLLLDQRKLPARETYIECRSAAATARAIKSMVVRGAPAIGVTAAFGLAVAARRFRAGKIKDDFEKAAALLAASRPTAVNLVWAIRRMRRLVSLHGQSRPEVLARRLLAEARSIMAEDIAANKALGGHGAKLIRRRGAVITHCNAGALATAGYGTALGVIRTAWQRGPRFEVYATETRPYLQGSRLTSWELKKLGIPVTLMTDAMVGHIMANHKIAAVVVGTDRTAANGDVANKIGTYSIAVLARRHGVPFYVAAPTSSIDLDCADGGAIPIEERDAREVTHLGGRRLAPEGIGVFNPAFDVTPAELVSAIITEHGVVRGDFTAGLARMVRRGLSRRAKSVG